MLKHALLASECPLEPDQPLNVRVCPADYAAEADRSHHGLPHRTPTTIAQETFDLNSFWITPFSSDSTVTLDAFRLGQWVGNYIFDVDAEQARVPITLPQPLFSVRSSGCAARA